MERGPGNQGRSLNVRWPGARRQRVVVSRLLGMSLLFRRRAWQALGLGRFHKELVVHHRDEVHENSLLNNLQVMSRREHAREHMDLLGAMQNYFPGLV